MRDRKLDRLFERFRSHGDVQALGQVFDATAPELLRVAASLVRDANEADDLLQQTFLTALERAERYDGSRRLVPWLLGILAHHAREQRRVRRRELDPTRLPEMPTDHPAQRAAARELEDELERALGTLSERERLVLDAHLRHGKTAPEIASELGAAPGAVRMQIHRGLDRLRRLLPVGLGAGGALGAQGLTVVRARVLRAGHESAGKLATGAGGAIGAAGTAGILMGKKVLLACVVAVLAAGVWWLRSAGEREAAGRGGEQLQATAAEPRGAGRAREDGAARSADASVELAPAAAPRALVAGGAPEHARLHGRVLEPDGRPVAAIAVALLELDEGELFPPRLGAEAPSAPRLLAAETRTDETGRFELDGARPRALHALGVDLGGERATLRVLDAACAAGATTDLGDVVLAPSGVLAGRVVDEERRPLANVRVRVGPVGDSLTGFGLHELVAGGALGTVDESGRVTLFELPEWLSALEARLPLATTTTDADGRFALAHAPAGSVTVLLDRPGRTPRAARTLELAPGARVELGELELGAGRTLRGRVLDAAGAPIAGAEVRAGRRNAELGLAVLAPPAASDAEGRFDFSGLSDAGVPVVVARRDALSPWQGALVSDLDFVRNGEFVVRLPAVQELLVEVVDARGAPVAAPELALHAGKDLDRLGVLQEPFRPVDARAREGEALWSLGPRSAGSYVVRARASGHAAALEPVEVTPDAPARLRLVLGDVRAVELLVQADGAPLAGATVRLESEHRPLLRASTDAAGRARLEVPAESSQPLVLRVEHARFAPLVRTLAAGESALTLALDAGATLRAHRGAPAGEGRGMLALYAPDARVPALIPFDREGRAEVPRLPAGEFAYAVYESLASREALACLGAGAPRALAEGRFELGAGQVLELELGAAAPAAELARATLLGTVSLDGRAAAGVTAFANPLDPPGPGARAEVSGGRFRFEGLAPGPYSVQLRMEPASSPAMLAQQRVFLMPADEQALEFELHAHTLAVRVVDDGGAPVRGASLSAFLAEEGMVGAFGESDGDGRASLLLAHAGLYLLRAAHPELGTATAQIEVPAEGEPAALELRLDRGVEFAGRLTVAPELPLAEGAMLFARSTLDPSAAAQGVLEREGEGASFRIHGLGAGPYSVQLFTGRAWSAESFVSLPEYGASALELHFVPPPVAASAAAVR